MATAPRPLSETKAHTIGLFDCVRLVDGVKGMERDWPEGSLGTIVEVYDGGAAYEVEFALPVFDVATVRAGQLIPA